MSQYIIVADITLTSGSKSVTVASGETLTQFIQGDLLFVTGLDVPLLIDSISGSTITLKNNAPSTLSNVEAALVAAKIPLREALDTIQTNNANWARHFGPFIEWLTSTQNTVTMYDTLGNPVTVSSVQGINSLVASAATAVTDIQAVEQRITQAETDLTTIEGTLNSKVSAAQTSETNAKASEDRANEWAESGNYVQVTPGHFSAKHHANLAKIHHDNTVGHSNDAKGFRDQAEAILDNFDDRYLGVKSTDPTLDNDGDALQDGAIYFNSTSKDLRFYVSGVWENPDQTVTNLVAQALAHKNNAEAAKNQAQTAKTDAETAKTDAETAKTDAETAKTDAESAELNAQSSATAANNHKNSASTSAALAQRWAAEAVDVVVSSGKYSAYHWAEKASASATAAAASATAAAASATAAANSATTAGTHETEAKQARDEAVQAVGSVTSPIFYAGTWDASGGTYPPAPADGVTGNPQYRIGVAGTINSIPMAVGDTLLYNGSSYDYYDNVEAITAVNGRTGNVVLNATDVGALAVGATAADSTLFGGVAPAGYVRYNASGGLNNSLANAAWIVNHGSNTNIDHIWHDDANNEFNFVSDGSLKAIGNSGLVFGKAKYSAGGKVVTVTTNDDHFGSNASGCLMIETGSGKTTIGMGNGSWSHFYTDAAGFYFNKNIASTGDIYSYQNSGNRITRDGIKEDDVFLKDKYVSKVDAGTGSKEQKVQNFQAIKGGNYEIDTTTTTTDTLDIATPVSPAHGDKFFLEDIGLNMFVKKAIIKYNGSDKIHGAEEDLAFDVNAAEIALEFKNTIGWKVKAI